MHQILQPDGWMKPKGYANGIAAAGRHVFVAGQIGWNEQCVFEAQDFVGQFRQALSNVVAVLAEAGAAPEHVTTMTWFVTNKAAYLRDAKAVGQIMARDHGPQFSRHDGRAGRRAHRGLRADRNSGAGGHPRMSRAISLLAFWRA